MEPASAASLNSKFNKIKAPSRQAGNNAYECIALFAGTALKNRKAGLMVNEGLSKFIMRYGKQTEAMRTKADKSHAIWVLFCRILQIKDLARTVFHGSVLNDILEGAYFSDVFCSSIQSLGSTLGASDEEVEETYNLIRQPFEGQFTNRDKLVGNAKSLFGKGAFDASDPDAAAIISAYDVSIDTLKAEVQGFKDLGYTAAVFDKVNPNAEALRWNRRTNLATYDNFNVE